MAQMFQKFGEEVETDNELKETFKAVGGVMYAGKILCWNPLVSRSNLPLITSGRRYGE